MAVKIPPIEGKDEIMYPIRRITGREQIDSGAVASVDIYNWGGEYRPETKATLCFWEGKGFLLKMTCREENPRAVYPFDRQNSMVCEDSCMEFFGNFAPEKENSGYLNFECNANGCLLCCYGPDRYQRKTVAEMGIPHPLPEAFRTGAEWGYELLIPIELLQKVYGKSEFSAGDRIRGSFYKCGDLTGHPHYGSDIPISIDHPDFHCPEFFGEMELV